ncbi:MAG: acylphosphatase [Spirochaetes bacterium]|nr:acylphosphatase [Spirochaetota bacterium]
MIFEIILKGRVQGVGCRYYCGKVGTRMSISGSASNMMNGSVKVLINAADRTLADEFAEAVRKNRYNLDFWGIITSVEINELPGSDISDIHGDYKWK